MANPFTFGAGTVQAPPVDYGSDLSMDFASDGMDLDPAMVETSGLPLLAQALARRIITPRGTLIDDANYGFDVRRFLNDDIGQGDLARIGAGVDAEFVKDERVFASSTTVTLTTTGVLTLVSSVQPSTGPTFSLVLAVSQVTVSILSPSL